MLVFGFNLFTVAMKTPWTIYQMMVSLSPTYQVKMVSDL